MKKLLIIIPILFILSGCRIYPETWSNDKIIEETKKCEEANMNIGVLASVITNAPMQIKCMPKQNN